ncbi:MAG: nitrogen fixation protein NifQ [Hyphomicrobiales bacterium]|nr:MAG: nitrogen fixation protein NifQ [Hyphomicrobiales bacterium]
MLDAAIADSSDTDIQGSSEPIDVARIFDRGIALSIFAKALAEQSARGGSLKGRLGLTSEEFATFARYCGWEGVEPEIEASHVQMADEQGWVRDLLQRHAEPGSPIAALLAPIVARRAMEANHLWEDLGLDCRGSLTRLMQRHFGELARLNTNNMRWKRFLYRRLCEEEGVSHCTSPTCSICPDVNECFDEGSIERSIAVGKQAPR